MAGLTLLAMLLVGEVMRSLGAPPWALILGYMTAAIICILAFAPPDR